MAIKIINEEAVERYLDGRCPECGADLVREATCYCPNGCGEWWGDRILKEFFEVTKEEILVP